MNQADSQGEKTWKARLVTMLNTLQLNHRLYLYAMVCHGYTEIGELNT